MNRAALIVAGKVWQVYRDSKPDFIIAEFKSRAAALYWVKKNFRAKYQSGELRVAKLIHEVP